MSIKRDIWDVLRTDLAIQKDLSRGLINTRALARHILKKYPIEASLDTAIVAIREFSSDKVFQKEEKGLIKMFRNSVIRTRDNVVCLTLKMSALGRVGKVLEKQDILRIVTGSKNIKLITDREKLNSVRSAFLAESMVKIEDGLGELSVTISPRGLKTRGILARIANEIALQDINIDEILICPPEFLIYVRQEDVLKTYDALIKLRKKAEK